MAKKSKDKKFTWDKRQSGGPVKKTASRAVKYRLDNQIAAPDGDSTIVEETKNHIKKYFRKD